MAERDHTSQLRRGVLELAILALVRLEPLYGGAIVDALAHHRGLEASAGTVYPLLTRLRNAGLLETHWEESPSGPPRKYYRLTSAGSTALTRMTAAWRQLATGLEHLLEES